MTDASVRLWGVDIGAVTWLEDREIGAFQYSKDILRSKIELAPLTMPLAEQPYSFPGLPRTTFKGLPGMLADSLPDKFGNKLIDAWLDAQGRRPESFNPVERLCYIGTRGMGALEFHPVTGTVGNRSRKLEVSRLVELANAVLDERVNLNGKLSGDSADRDALEDILRVGTSAGGARAKAVVAWNELTGEFRSGQVGTDDGSTYWLMKFDGVNGNADKELADPQGFGKIEYAYYLMAIEAGIQMEECRLYNEGGRSHFMTKRFDRTDSGDKIHMQSLTAMMHYDFNDPTAYSYEQVIKVIRRLKSLDDIEQQVLRSIFNVIARNQDDHVKNIAFLMDKRGKWRLSPAFDVSYSFNPSGAWTSRHQMSLNGKRDAFSRSDLLDFCASAGLTRNKSAELLARVFEAVGSWRNFAESARVPERDFLRIEKTFRADI